jgi:hypothetical protein
LALAENSIADGTIYRIGKLKNNIDNSCARPTLALAENSIADGTIYRIGKLKNNINNYYAEQDCLRHV